MVTRGLEAPDEINIFSSSVQWFFQPSQCFVNIDSWKMATKIHEDGVQNTLSMVFAGDYAPHRLQFFWQQFPSLHFSFRGQQLEQVLVDVVLLPYILICLAEQLWVGQAIDTCLYTVTYEAFAPCSQLIIFLLNSCTTKSAQQINTYVTSCTWTVRSIAAKLSTHVPEECTAYQHVCHFNSWKMNHQERTVKNVITANPPHATPSETATRNKQRSNMYVNSVRWTCLKPEDLVRHLYVTSTPLKSIKRIFILHSINVVDSCSNFKNVQTIRAPSLRGNLWPSLFVIPAADGLIGGHLAIRLNAMLQAEELPAPKRSAIDPRNLKNMGLSENRVYSQL